MEVWESIYRYKKYFDKFYTRLGYIAYFVKKLKDKIIHMNHKREKKMWVFGEWFGNRICDNSFYLANYIAHLHPEINLYWVAKSTTDTKALDPSIHVIEMDHPTSVKILKKAGVAIMNQGFIDFSSTATNYFGGAITINLWHGLMWKKVYYDTVEHAGILSYLYHKMIPALESADYWLVPSSAIEGPMRSAFALKDKSIIHAGYPRNSMFYIDEWVMHCREKISKKLDIEGKIIAYMPTFRDKTEEVFSFEKLMNDPKLKIILQDNNAYIVEKSHYVLQSRKQGEQVDKGRIFFHDEIPAAELLAASDILITDYSSCFFDYLILNRAIIHYIYDYDYYINSDRGVYYTKEDVACGKIPETVEELLEAIEGYLKDPGMDSDLRMKQRQRFWEYDSVDACEVIYQRIRRIQENRRMEQ